MESSNLQSEERKLAETLAELTREIQIGRRALSELEGAKGAFLEARRKEAEEMLSGLVHQQSEAGKVLSGIVDDIAKARKIVVQLSSELRERREEIEEAQKTLTEERKAARLAFEKKMGDLDVLAAAVARDAEAVHRARQELEEERRKTPGHMPSMQLLAKS